MIIELVLQQSGQWNGQMSDKWVKERALIVTTVTHKIAFVTSFSTTYTLHLKDYRRSWKNIRIKSAQELHIVANKYVLSDPLFADTLLGNISQ